MKTKPTVWLCPDANDASSASGCLTGVARRGARLLKKQNPEHFCTRGFVFWRCDSCFPNGERSEVMCKKHSLTLLSRDHCICTGGAAVGAPKASRSDWKLAFNTM